MKFLHELRHRQVFQLTGIYVAGAWGLLEVADIVFAALGIPETALRYVLIAEIVLFPIVFVMGWRFDIRRDGLFRSAKDAAGEITSVPLGQRDYVVLTALAAVAIAVTLFTVAQVWNSADELAGPLAGDVERTANSVAILPFANLDTNPDTGYFSDGVTEEILHRLASNRALHVLGRSSSFAFRGSDLALADISKILGVEYLLEGSVRRDGDVVRVTARLTDETGVQVWSETFDRRLEAIFAIQSEIASAVASRIAHEIMSSGSQSVTRTTNNMEAYNEYLVGRELAHGRGADWRVKSEAAFRRAIELDPEFAPAYAGLAYSLFIMASVTPERLDQALAAVRKSLELEPELALGHAMLGTIQGARGLASLEEAEQHLRRALELDPALSDAYNWLSLNLRNQGRLEESDAVWAQGLQIDPLHPSLAGNYANDRANHGDYDGAMRILQRFTHLPQMGGAVIFGLGTVNRDYGRYAKSIAGYPTHWDALSYAALGFHDEADRLIEDIGNLYILALGKRAILHTRGEHAEAWAFVSAYLSNNGYEFKTLDPTDQAWILETQVFGGDYSGAIQRFESLGGGERLAWIEDVDGTLVARLLNAIGFAYLQSGDTDAAMSVLSIEPMRLAHYKPWSSPLFLAPMALNAALQGDDDLAYERLSQAVDKGWADYYRAINDPRWGDTLQQPRFVKLLERVQEDLAEQRAEVEALLADAD